MLSQQPLDKILIVAASCKRKAFAAKVRALYWKVEEGNNERDEQKVREEYDRHMLARLKHQRDYIDCMISALENNSIGYDAARSIVDIHEKEIGLGLRTIDGYTTTTLE